MANKKAENYSTNEENNEKESQAKYFQARRVIAIITLTATCTCSIGATLAGVQVYKDYIESKIAQEIVDTNTTYIGSSKTLSLQNANINRDYDVKVCSGFKLEESILKSEIDICQIGDTLYTNDGCDIALLEFRVTRQEVKKANETKLSDGTIIYSADEGFTLEDNKQVRVIVSTERKIITANASHDYSQETYQDENVVSSELISENTQEYPTHPFSEITESTLILDVEDNNTTYRLTKS